MQKKLEIVLSPRLASKLDKIKDRSQIERLMKLIEKLESSGIESAKHLVSIGDYALYEMKSKRPPYRLYIIYNNAERIAYLYDWEHKDKQEQILSNLRKIIKKGLDDLFNSIS